MDWKQSFTRYAADPFSGWPEDRPLQARKLVESLGRYAAARSMQPDAAINGAIVSASERSVRPAPTLFLINCGSSGSHWVEAMVAALGGVYACGEVYLPPGIDLGGLETQERVAFIDALHQLHMEHPAAVDPSDILINSAHSWGPHDAMGASAAAVLLVRDPIDVVASRTFRKPRLRRYLTPDASDSEYLDRNIAYVDKFYRSALRRKPAHVIRYEDFTSQPVETLGRLATLLSRKPDQERLDEIVRTYSAAGQQDSGRRLSNVFQGPRVSTDPDLRQTLTTRLARIRSDLGYG